MHTRRFPLLLRRASIVLGTASLVVLMSGCVQSRDPTVGSVQEGGPINVTPLLRTTTGWDGAPLSYPPGQAEVTGLMVELEPGAETGWHLHSVPSFAMILAGELEIRLKDGRVQRVSAGDAVAEVVDTWHNGRNPGNKPTKLVVFYAGSEGGALTSTPEQFDE